MSIMDLQAQTESIIKPPVMASLRRPSKEDWDNHKPLIKELYVDDDMSLKEVMEVLLKQGHKASMRTYKSYIKKWGLEKYNKEREMVAIVRMKRQRDRIGKRSSFRVRGRPVGMNAITKFIRRKTDIPAAELLDAATPSDVSCSTPPPLISPRSSQDDDGSPGTSRTAIAEHEAYKDDQDPQTFDYLSESAKVESHTYSQALLPTKTTLLCTGRGSRPASPSPRAPAYRALTFGPYPNQYHGRESGSVSFEFSDRVNLPRSPLPPQALLLPEQLFHQTTTYIRGAFQSGNWLVGEDGKVQTRTQTSAVGKRSAAYDIFMYCWSAVDSMEKKLFVQSRKALSKAFDLLPGTLRNCDPLSLSIMLQTLVMLEGRGYPEVSQLIRNHVLALAKATSIRQHCNLFAHILQQGSVFTLDIVAMWKCVVDGISRVAPLSSDTWRMRVAYIEDSSRDNLVAQHSAISQLLAESEATTGPTATGTLVVLYSLIDNLRDQQRFSECLLLIEKFLDRAKIAGITALQGSGYVLMAGCYKDLRREDLAEHFMRNAIRLQEDHYGKNDSHRVYLCSMLEQWLREWGREQEADKLNAEVADLIGPDDTE